MKKIKANTQSVLIMVLLLVALMMSIIFELTYISIILFVSLALIVYHQLFAHKKSILKETNQRF